LTRCTICNNTTTPIDSGKKRYYRCQNCDFIFLDHSQILDSKTEKIRYLFHNNTIENLGYVKMFEKFFDKIFPLMAKVKTILDFGCGPGPVMAELLKRKGYEVFLYDIYFNDIKQNLENEYDLIISTEVFEHLKDPKRVMQQLVKIIKPNGYLALMTRFHPEDSEKFKSWYYKADETHIGFFTPQTFKYLANEFNLKILYHDGYDTVLMQK